MIVSPLVFAKKNLSQKSRNISYVKKTFENVLLGRKKSECDDLVENNIFNCNLIDGNIYYFNDTELFQEYKIYKTDHFEIKVLFEKSFRCGATKIIVTEL